MNLKDLMDQLVSSIAVRLEREFIFEDENNNTIYSTCYVSPPRVGEYITIKNVLYIIQSVTHLAENNGAGTIIIKKL